MKKYLLIALLAFTQLSAQSINIAVAANVSYAMDELQAAFKKKNPNAEVRVTLGSSGKLTAQIKNGAPYSLFMSANMLYPETLYKEKYAVTKPIVYAQGALAYFSAKPQDFSNPLALLKSSGVQKIAIANPTTAPYGKAAKEALKNMGVYKEIKPKLIYAESISHTVSYTVTAADIGFIAKSSLFSPKMSSYKQNVNWSEVDSSTYKAIEQGIVILKYGEKSAQAKAFYEFILSQEARDIFKKYGYSL